MPTTEFNRKPVVAVATGIMNAGGTESLIMETFRQASGKVRYILLIHYDNSIQPGVYDEEISQLGIEVHYIQSVGSAGVKSYIKAFKELNERIGGIDILHSHLNGVGGIISMAAKQAGIKHRICHCHADIHFTGSRIARIKNELSLWGMKAFIELFATERWACSKDAWRRLFYPWHKCIVINNMIDTKKYIATDERRTKAKTKFGLEGKFVVGAVGRVAPIKNYECILRSIVNTDVHFVCFGRFDINNAYCHSLEKLANELGVADRVHWMGNSNDVSSDIHCIDLFVMPSFTEGFGMAAIEAQAASIPTLLSTGVPEIVDVNLNLVKRLNPNDVTQWTNAIREATTKELLQEAEILQKFGVAGFDSATAVKEIENQYLSIFNQ